MYPSSGWSADTAYPGYIFRQVIFNCKFHTFKFRIIAQVLFRNMHCAVELAEFYISYNDEILELVNTCD